MEYVGALIGRTGIETTTGNFYVNYTLKGVTQPAVAAALAGRVAAVTAAVNGAVVVFDAESDKQDADVVQSLGAKLSADLGCPVLAVLNHDDDVLWYQLHVAGNRIDEYDSSPGYFDDMDESAGPTGGDAGKLCSTFAGDSGRVEAILRKPDRASDLFNVDGGYLFADERHADLVNALGLPPLSVGTGYETLDDLDPSVDGPAADAVVHTR